MEVGGNGTRPSGNPSPSSNGTSPFDRRPREGLERPPYRDGPAMATASIMSPSGPFHPPHHHAPYPTSHPYSAPATSIPGMISPVEPRRAGEDGEVPQRQSLPSLHEALGGNPPGPPYAPASAGPAPPPLFPSPATSRSFGDAMSDKAPSPMSLHSVAPKFPRPDVLQSVAPHRRPVPPPLATFTASNPPPALKMDQMEAERRPDLQHHQQPPPQQQPQPQQPSPNYPPSAHPHSANPRSATQPPSAYPPPPGRLPPGQMALPSYPPVSPHYNGAPLPSPREPQIYRPATYPEEVEYANNNRGSPPYKPNSERVYQGCNYDESLQLIQSTARTFFAFAEAYTKAHREQPSDQPIPSRLPTENEVSALINSAIMVQCKLEQVRDMVQATRLNSERAQGTAVGVRKGFEDEDVPMYGDGLKHFQVSEIKKRRGRAAPPGRCHSCNRMDTPEWRRGPDGARTLCNACGLHYAKLERRRQLQDRNPRPKSSEERS